MRDTNEQLTELLRDIKAEKEELHRRVQNLQHAFENAYDRYIYASMQLEQRDDTLVALHRALFVTETKLSEASEALEHTSPTKELCMCCFNEIHTIDAIRCNGTTRHAFCVECVESMSKSKRDRICQFSIGCLPCMCVNDCQGVIDPFCNMPYFDRYYRDYTIRESMPHITRNITIDDTTDAKLQMMRSDGTFFGLQCTNCNYGPMWNDHCSELLTHHNQETDTGTNINNACPRCGVFVQDIAQMQRWDGTTCDPLSS
jgi:hypothetical protein